LFVSYSIWWFRCFSFFTTTSFLPSWNYIFVLLLFFIVTSFLPKLHLCSPTLFHCNLIPFFLNYIFVLLLFFITTLFLPFWIAYLFSYLVVTTILHHVHVATQIKIIACELIPLVICLISLILLHFTPMIITSKLFHFPPLLTLGFFFFLFSFWISIVNSELACCGCWGRYLREIES